jgi:hypothetical protein
LWRLDRGASAFHVDRARYRDVPSMG